MTTENQAISQQSKATNAFNALMADIKARRRDIEAVLPADVPFEKFQACLNIALRRDPVLLECHGPSLIRAAIMSAYDGLMPDGKQAVILWRVVKFKERRDGPERKRLEAQYQPMVYGIRMKVVASGAARHIYARCVYRKEHFVWEEGLNPILEHKPIQDNDASARGELWAVYSIATLPDGERVFEVMRKGDVLKRKAVAMTDKIWNAWDEEMWMKTVIRHHAKALPTVQPFRDAEAEVMFPDFAGQSSAGALPAPARPTRDQFAQLEAPGVELPLDLSGFGDDGIVVGVEDERVPEKEKPAQSRKKSTPAKAKEEQHEDQSGADDQDRRGSGRDGEENGAAGDAGSPEGGQPAGEGAETAEPALERPHNDAGWRQYQTTVLAEIGKAKGPDILDRINARERDNIAAAPPKVRSSIESSLTDMRIDLSDKGED